MLLILAEYALSIGNLDDAKNRMIESIERASDRPRVGFDDKDTRDDAILGQIRPRNSGIKVRDDATGPFREGVLLDRPGTIDTPVVSGSSLTAEDVEAASDVGSLTRLLFLLRQEILFLEGRRMHDLGIRLPMMQREVDTNPNITDGDTGTRVFVPDYIPPANELDLYSPVQLYEGDSLLTTQVTILHDMNRILAVERGLVMQDPMLP
ncbi:MAG: hypothetical protein HKN37_02595 [Rhodothermales bacterium]|nr:hypothetical protein [Rhodothermales bacterium]